MTEPEVPLHLTHDYSGDAREVEYVPPASAAVHAQQLLIAAAYGDRLDLDDVAELADLWVLLTAADTLKRAAGLVVKAVEAEVAARLGEGGHARFADTFLRVGPDRERTLPRPAELIEWLGDDWQAAIGVTARNVRVTGIAAVAAERGIDPQTAIDTFLPAVEKGEAKLQRVPIDRAPNYARRLASGQFMSRVTKGLGEGEAR